MSLLDEIPKGEKGWKLRRLDIQIMEIMQKATIPQTGWHIFQKLRKIDKSADGSLICERMYYLHTQEFLKVVGTDPDCGYEYELIK